MHDESGDHAIYVQRHLRVGWSAFLLFATLGLVLESLHGFKVRAYLDVSNDTRRLMWTLAHAHGVLLGLVNVLVGLSIRILPEVGLAHRRLMSRALLAATVLIPGGFFLGGVLFYGGDPGLGVPPRGRVPARARCGNGVECRRGPARARVTGAKAMTL